MTDRSDGIGQPIRRSYEHSRVRRGVTALRRLAATPEPAVLRQRRVAVARTIRLAGEHALTTRIARRAARSIRNARFYDWLTREPETSIVVVDLAETWTVGPIIAVVDRFVERFGWIGSRASRVGDPVRRLGSERPVSVLGVVVTSLVALVWGYLWTAGSSLVPLVAVAGLAVAALFCSRVAVSASSLATPLSYRLVMGILLPPAGPPDGEPSDGHSADDEMSDGRSADDEMSDGRSAADEMSDDRSADGPSAQNPADAVDAVDDSDDG